MGTLENNIVHITGTLAKEFAFIYKMYGEAFYASMISVKRLSGTIDCIPIIVPDILFDYNKSWIGEKVKITGTFRSYNKHTETGNHLILSVFADEIVCAENDEPDENEIHLGGYICKEVRYRETPFHRNVSDILLAVNRRSGKSDYIPCIVWGRSAKIANSLNIGAKISLFGRIQSREYQKKLENGEVETRTAYEVSASKFLIEEREVEKNGNDDQHFIRAIQGID